MKQIFIIEDEIVVAKSIEDILVHNNFIVAGIATGYTQAKQKLLTIQPDLILCDINLNSEKNGIELMAEIEPAHNVPFIFISAYSDLKTIQQAHQLVPFNYITKPFNDKQLLTSVQRALIEKGSSEAECPTDRELSILKLIARGLSTKEIADSLHISFNTVESHRKNLMRKYNVRSMAALICLATSMGWVEYKTL